MSEYYKLKRLSKQAMPRTGRVLDAGGFVGGVRGSSASGGGSGIVVPGHNELGGLVNSESYLRTDRYVHLTGEQLYELTNSVASRLSFVDGYLLYTADELGAEAVKVKAGFADEFPDIVETRKTFKAGAEVSDLEVDETLKVGKEVIDSMGAGKGTLVTPDKIQTPRLEVRGSAVFMELIYNRLSAMEGDYSFSESGTIDSLELIDTDTYRLSLRKRWDNDFTAFEVNDICYGVINDLTTTGIYSTSWFRVLSKNITSNTITVVMYPDSEVPGRVNAAPTESMMITRRGNVVNEDRQGFWYLSSYEKCICMLDGVKKPILEEYNYSVIVGKLKQLNLFDNLPINYKHSYVYCRGIALQDILRIAFDGVPIIEERNRQSWSMQVAMSDKPYRCTDKLVDTVRYMGCKYNCLIDATTDTPRYNATGWVMTEGNPDFTIEIDSSRGFDFDYDNFSTTLMVTGRLHNQNITADILDADVYWTRDTDNIAEDNNWAIKHAGVGKSLPLTIDDLGPEYTSRTSIKFTATAYLADGRHDTYSIDF